MISSPIGSTLGVPGQSKLTDREVSRQTDRETLFQNKKSKNQKKYIVKNISINSIHNFIYIDNRQMQSIDLEKYLFIQFGHIFVQ